MRTFILFCTFVQISWAKSSQPDSQTKAFVDAINSNQSIWTAGYNPDQESPKKFAQRRLGLMISEPDPDQKIKFKTPINTKATIPETFDAREQWPECRDLIDTIVDQGNCASAWAITTTSALSDRLCIQSNGKVKFRFSATDLMGCCSNCGSCSGGNRFLAWLYASTTSLVSEGCKPYDTMASQKGISPTCERSCSNPLYNISYDDDKRSTETTYQLRQPTEIQQDIMTYGPTTTSLTFYEDLTQYKKGVYYYVTGERISTQVVKIIGWGVENSIPYWLAANSFGTGWALGGYFKIRRGNNECGIEENVIAGRPKCPECKDQITIFPSPGSAIRMVNSGVAVLVAVFLFFYV